MSVGGLFFMARFDLFSHHKEDRELLKYFWYFIFLLHITFLGMGIYWLNEGYKLLDAHNISKGELRLDTLFLAIHMESVAFSIILLVIAIYVYVIHRKQNMILKQMREIRSCLEKENQTEVSN
jgi:hypothetical protein